VWSAKLVSIFFYPVTSKVTGFFLRVSTGVEAHEFAQLRNPEYLKTLNRPLHSESYSYTYSYATDSRALDTKNLSENFSSLTRFEVALLIPIPTRRVRFEAARFGSPEGGTCSQIVCRNPGYGAKSNLTVGLRRRQYLYRPPGY
jgi:hypothetical protein